jgi:large subunit ribosomal protein L9
MSKTIQVILLEDIPSLGGAGDIVQVSEGYARNALFPQSKAALATATARQAKAEQTRRQAEAAAAFSDELKNKAEVLAGSELTLRARVKEGDEIFGSITARDIATALTKQTSLAFKPKQIKLTEPITRLGSYDLEVSLSSDISTTIRLTVLNEPT